jgi:hypothetical protein
VTEIVKAAVEAAPAGPANPVRNCLACGQTDDHPRHVVDLGEGREVSFHMDCHARMNPACPLCVEQTSGVPAGTIGEDLRAHLVSLPPKAHF